MGIACTIKKSETQEIKNPEKPQFSTNRNEGPGSSLKNFKFDKNGILNLQKNFSQHEEQKKRIDQIKVCDSRINPDGKFITNEAMNKEIDIHMKELEKKLGEFKSKAKDISSRTKSITRDPFQYNLGNCIYKGGWNDGGLREGYGQFLDEDRRMYKGYWRNGTIVEGRIFEKDGSYYQGSIENGKPNGKGGLYFLDGTVYEGEWSDGCQIHGERRYPDGKHYKGNFKGNMFQDEGTITWKDGSNYRGNFEKGIIEGEGTYTNSNGDIYCGSFMDNMAHGNGRFLTNIVKVVYEGEYNHGTKEGNGVISNQKGDYYKGKWLNNLPHGYGVMKLNNITTSGFWRHGKFYYEPTKANWPLEFKINEGFKKKSDILYEVVLMLENEELQNQEEIKKKIVVHNIWKPCGPKFEMFMNWEDTTQK